MPHNPQDQIIIMKTSTGRTIRHFCPSQAYPTGAALDTFVQDAFTTWATFNQDFFTANSIVIGTLDRYALCTLGDLDSAPSIHDPDASDAQIDVVNSAVVVTPPA